VKNGLSKINDKTSKFFIDLNLRSIYHLYMIFKFFKKPEQIFLCANSETFSQNLSFFLNLITNQNNPFTPEDITIIWENEELKNKIESAINHETMNVKFSKLEDFLKLNKKSPVVLLTVEKRCLFLSRKQKKAATKASRLTVFTSENPKNFALRKLPTSSSVFMDGKLCL
jgi:hypothetical protein